MKKHILRQKYEVEDNNGNLEKQFDYQICLQEKGINKENIMNMFNYQPTLQNRWRKYTANCHYIFRLFQKYRKS